MISPEQESRLIRPLINSYPKTVRTAYNLFFFCQTFVVGFNKLLKDKVPRWCSCTTLHLADGASGHSTSRQTTTASLHVIAKHTPESVQLKQRKWTTKEQIYHWGECIYTHIYIYIHTHITQTHTKCIPLHCPMDINCPPGNILNLSLITLRGTRSITTCVHTPTADFLSIYGLVVVFK
jgi:hypothetical protein